MGIKLGDISPIGGALTGKGMFGKGLGKLADSGLGMLVPMSYLAKSQRDKNNRRTAATAAEAKAIFDAKRNAAAGIRARPMVEDIMVAEEAPAGAPMMRKGGKVKKMAKGGSTASKRGDGCATKGKTKGRFV
jgi:hypothetical protein